MKGREFKDIIFFEIARIAKGVANPRRLEIIDLLCQSEKSVETLARETNQSIAGASHHLQFLKNCRLVNSRKEGQYVYYSIDSAAQLLWKSLTEVGEKNIAEISSAVNSFFNGSNAFKRISLTSLKKKVASGEILLLDVRPEDEFRAGHFPGAISIPLKKLKGNLKSLPKDKPVVAYCRGPYCIMAEEAVNVLKKNNFNAQRSAEGLLEWSEEGLSMEIGPVGI